MFFTKADAINFNIIAYCWANWRKVRVTAAWFSRDASPPPFPALFILIFRERVANYDIDSLYKYFRTFPAKKHGRKEGSMARPPVESPYEAFVHLPNEDISAKIRWNERWPSIFRSDDFLQKVWSSVVNLRGGYRVYVFHAQNYSVYR